MPISFTFEKSPSFSSHCSHRIWNGSFSSSGVHPEEQKRRHQRSSVEILAELQEKEEGGLLRYVSSYNVALIVSHTDYSLYFFQWWWWTLFYNTSHLMLELYPNVPGGHFHTATIEEEVSLQRGGNSMIHLTKTLIWNYRRVSSSTVTWGNNDWVACSNLLFWLL